MTRTQLSMPFARPFTGRTRSGSPLPALLVCGVLAAVLALAGPVAAQPPVLTTLHGASPGDQFGFAVAGAGDFNADGKDDILVGAPGADDFGPDSGAAYVFYGGAPPTAGPVLQGFSLDGTERGYAVASAGRFNDDGVDDIVMCQRGGQSVASVYLGGSPPPTGVSYALYPTQPGTQIVDPDAWYTFCDAIGRTDFNGDGMDDLMIGAPLYSDSRFINSPPVGRAYLYFGRPLTGPVETFADHILDAGSHLQIGDRFGTSVVGLDFDGDGYGDFAVGATGTNKVFLYFGSASGVPGTPMVFSEPTGGYGNTLTTGDLNYDGRADLVVGAADSVYNSSAESRIYVYDGGPTPDTVADHVYQTATDWTEWGWSVAVVDPEADGYDNLLTADPSWYDDGGGYLDRGRVYDLAKGWRFDGPAWADRFGYALANLGDVTGDGKEDFAVGAPQSSSDGGYVRIYRGYTPDVQPCRKCPIIENNPESNP